MIVIEKNWEGQLYKEFKNLIIADLFDKIGVAISTKLRKDFQEVNDDYCDELSKKVDNYFYNLVASDTPLSALLPDRLKDSSRFYIFAIKILPTGGILLTFIALLDGKVEPCELQLMY